MNETNWITQSANPTVTEVDIRGLEKAHRLEAKLKNKGYKWVKVNDRTKVFVECDEHGKPTEKGNRQIRAAQKACE